MAEDPGSLSDRIGDAEDVSQYLDLLKKAPSEHAKTAMVREKLVPCIQKKVGSPSATSDILDFLIPKYAAIQTRPLLRAFCALLRELYSLDKTIFFSSIIRNLEAAVARVSVKINASSNYFTLLTWVNETLVLTSNDKEDFMKYHKELVRFQTTLIQYCLVKGTKRRIRLASYVDTKSSLRIILGRKETGLIEEGIKGYISVLVGSNQSSFAAGVVLGILAGLSKQLGNEAANKLMEQSKNGIYEFFNKEFIASKVSISNDVMSEFKWVFTGYTSQEDFEGILSPALARGILRSPEIVLKDIIPFLSTALRPEIDFSNGVSEHLLPQILSSMKSNNSSIRDASQQASIMLIARCKVPETLRAIAETLQKSYKDGSYLLFRRLLAERSLDTRMVLVRVLAAMPKLDPQLCLDIANLVIQMLAKETNEMAVSALIDAFMSHRSITLQNDIPMDEKSLKIVTSGVVDKRSRVRCSWAVAVSDAIWSHTDSSKPSSAMVAFSKAVAKDLFNTVKEYTSNPLQALQNGTISAAYAISAVSLGRWLSWGDNQLAQLVKSEGSLITSSAATSKGSFLLNERIYTKLANETDQIWAIRALLATAVSSSTELSINWSLAVIYFVANPKNPRTVRDVAEAMLVDVLTHIKPRINAAIMVVSGLEDWLRQIEDQKDGPALTAGASSISRLSTVIKALLDQKFADDKSYLEQCLKKIFVLCHHPQLPRHQLSWTDLSSRAAIDPGVLVEGKTESFLEEIQEKLWPSEDSKAFHQAAYSACGTLAFINPEKAIPLIVKEIEDRLSPEKYTWLTESDIQIWKGTEGVLVHDVLQKPTPNGAPKRGGKNDKNMDWEAELRAELERKRGNATKLSAKDQALVNEQLAKESAIRKRVEEVRQTNEPGLGMIGSLVNIPSNLGIDLWYSKILETLLRGVLQQCGGLVGHLSVATYVNLSNVTSTRLGLYRTQIGFALLRSMNVSQVPENWTQEPLSEMNLRVLYRLRFLGEQHPLDLTSFQYCLPLALQVLAFAKGSQKNPSEAEEQITLALEFISFHSVEYPELPRAQVVEKILDVMSLMPAQFKLSKDTFLQVTDAISATETKEELRLVLGGLLSASANVRNVVLQALEPFDLEDNEGPEILFLALHDSDERNVELAMSLYKTNSVVLDDAGLERLFLLLEHPTPYVREAAAKALATALPSKPDLFENYLDKFVALYHDKAKPVPPKYDKYGMLVKADVTTLSPAKVRLSVAVALERLNPVIPLRRVDGMLQFLIGGEALGDADASVREKMLAAGISLIESHGKQRLEGILNILNGYLGAPAKSSEVHDRIREAAVILLGAAARHLKADDSRGDAIIDKLLATLKTPSESVQLAVCDCLPPLIRARPHRVPDLIKQLMKSLLSAPKYAERRGAAFGIAGIVSGAGIEVLYSSDLLSQLATAISSKKDAKSREGALFAYEALLYSLGRLFEPFVSQILPYLLITFGDSATEVRTATSDTSKMIMRTISGHCVKAILPSLLAGLEEPQWRSKKGSIEMLGAMAYLAPKQLSISLPTVVPKLTSVLTDSHTQVRAAANSSLLRFGEVISNPEIQEMVPVLLKALGDPNKFTEPALDKLLGTAFIHYIDGPSLALVFPILGRGLKERNASSRRKSARILGSLGNLTDQRDLISYLTDILPPLRDILSDAIPENRASAATSLGLLVEKLGEDNFPDLIDSLMDDLRVENSGIGRLGSGQALSEILSALGLHRLEDVLPEILKDTENRKPSVREAFINLLVYLPATFGNRFQPYLAQTVPKILVGLADDVDAVREASLRAGRIVVTNYAVKAVDILLPELEKAFFDDRWQIRHSSVELVGSMMYQLVGINKRPEGEDEEVQEEATESQRAALVEVLGQERRDRILSALYIARQDVSGIVRITAAQVFKTLVSNPQKVVREMLPTMTNMIVKNLASADEERRQGSARTLGDIVRKFGQGTLSELLPVLQQGLHSHDAVHVQGICIALVEIMKSASKEALENFQDMLCNAVKEALQHPNQAVQRAAAVSFDALQQQFPQKAIESIIPTLLHQLGSESEAESEIALVALREIMKGRSNARILGSLLPSLTTIPISAVNAKALGSLAEAAGDAIYPRLGFILQSLMDSLVTVKSVDWVEELSLSFKTITLSVEEDEGLRIVLTTLSSALKHENPKRRDFALVQAGFFFKETSLDFSRYASHWATALVSAYAERDVAVARSAVQTLTAMASKLEPDELEDCVTPVRQAVLTVGVENHDLPGFGQPGGLNGVLTIYLAGLKRQSAEEAANGIAEMVLRTSLNSLKPVTVQMIGALIRAIGERHPPAGKTAILHALATLLVKAPLFAKPFIPQLQRTAVKNLSDPANGDVRNQAAVVLGSLIPMQPRVDPLVTELVGVANSAQDDGVKFAVLKALCEVLSRAGKLVGESQRAAISSLMEDILTDGRGQVIAIGVRLLSLLVKVQPSDISRTFIQSSILDAGLSRNSIVALNALVLDPPSSILTDEMIEQFVSSGIRAAQDTEDYISESGILLLGKILTSSTIEAESDLIMPVFKVLGDIIRKPPSGSTDSQRLALVVIRTTSRKKYELIEPHVPSLLGPVVTCARDSNVFPLKVAAERAFTGMFRMELNGTALLENALHDVHEPLKRSVQEYTKRIASKIATLESYDSEELAEDMLDDEREIASVGGMTF